MRGIFHKYLLGLAWLAILSREKYVIWPRLATTPKEVVPRKVTVK